MEDVRWLLSEIAGLFEDGGEELAATTIRDALRGGEGELRPFLKSNDLWGGAGSLCDQGLIDDPNRRPVLERQLAQLGRSQAAIGVVNVRANFWVSAFEKHLSGR